MTRNILIAGGAGFIGSFVCDHYVSNGDTVICIDNLATGSERNIKQLLNKSNFSFVQGDICEPLPAEVTNVTYDCIINLASPASPPHYQRLAIETLKTGSIGTMQLLELTKRDKARLFYASTSEVYGSPEVHPQPEDYWGNVNSYGERSMYDESKRFSEALIFSYRKKYGLNTAIGRFFNTYGPRMEKNDGRVVSNFINQALEGKDITIYGDGDQTRSFCYVADLVEGVIKLIESDVEGPVNLGNPGEFTISELADIILELFPSKSQIVNKPLPADDPQLRQPDITKARELLDWEPTTELSEGLKKTAKYFRALAN